MAHEDGVSVSDKAGRVIVEVNYDDERVSSANEAMRLAITTAAAAAATEVMGCSEVPN
jgi:ribosomal protein L16/L10AE